MFSFLKETTFKKIFVPSELRLSGKEDLQKMGLTKYEVDGKIYYVFCGTGTMLRALPLTN